MRGEGWWVSFVRPGSNHLLHVWSTFTSHPNTRHWCRGVLDCFYMHLSCAAWSKTTEYIHVFFWKGSGILRWALKLPLTWCLYLIYSKLLCGFIWSLLVAPGNIIAKTILGDAVFTISPYMWFKSPANEGDKAHWDPLTAAWPLCRFDETLNVILNIILWYYYIYYNII